MAARASSGLPLRDVARTAGSGVEASRKAIVIADPDAGDRWLLAQPLAAHYDVYEAADGVHAFALARMIVPAVVVCSAELPAIDGLTLATLVRGEPQLGHVAIVYLGDRADPATIADAMRAGARRFIAKPFVPDSVAAAIARMLEVPPVQP
jgi:CheY-like chemotaxis protein